MGPIALFDKSFLQSIGVDESVWFDHFSMPMVCPIFYVETLGGAARLPDLARRVLQVLAAQIEQLEVAVAAIEKRLMAWHKRNLVSQRLASIPGIGPIIATAIATTVEESTVFRSGREFAAWLGLVPRQNSTGGKTRL
jgi:transposase